LIGSYNNRGTKGTVVSVQEHAASLLLTLH